MITLNVDLGERSFTPPLADLGAAPFGTPEWLHVDALTAPGIRTYRVAQEACGVTGDY